MSTFLEIGLILALATSVAILMQALRLPLILGHIVTGILVGPAFLNLLQSKETLTIFSQLGITALLFIVGLSLSPTVAREVGKVSVVTGLGQIVFTSVIGFFICRLLGFSPISSLYLAVALTFSSTIIILKLLSDRNDLGKLYGKISIGFLLVQDIVATILLIGISSFATGFTSVETAAITILKIFGIAILLILAGRTILPRLVRFFAASQEFLFLFAVGWGVGLAALFHYLGLSVEIGALVAGVSLASSPYHYEISAKMKMLRDFFIIMFFILLGSQLTPGSLAQSAVPAIILSFFILIGNPLIVMMLMGALSYTKKAGFYAGLTVAQISEFSFILILLGIEKGHIPPELSPLITSVGLVTIAGSALMIIYADHLYRIFEPLLDIFERRRPIHDRRKRERADAMLFGCHRVGTDFLPSLEKLGLKTLVIDFDPEVVDRLRAKQVACRYGDAGDNEFLDELDLAHAKLVISTVPDFETNQLVLHKAHEANPETAVITTAHSVDEANLLYQDGASYVIMPHFLGGNRAAMILERHGPDAGKLSHERRRHLEHLKTRAA